MREQAGEFQGERITEKDNVQRLPIQHARPKFDLVHAPNLYYFHDGEFLPQVSVLPRVPGVQGWDKNGLHRNTSFMSRVEKLITWEQLPMAMKEKYIRMYKVLDRNSKSLVDHYAFAWEKYVVSGGRLRTIYDTDLRHQFNKDLLKYDVVEDIDQYSMKDLIDNTKNTLKKRKDRMGRLASIPQDRHDEVALLQKQIDDMTIVYNKLK